MVSVIVVATDVFNTFNFALLNKMSSNSLTLIIPVSAWRAIYVIFQIALIAATVYEHYQAWQVMKRERIAACYLNNLAMKLTSVRLGKTQGWKRFLVFMELSQSKKGFDHVALFTFFRFYCKISPGAALLSFDLQGLN